MITKKRGANQTMKKQIFDDFPKVDCNDCENYYTNACDGALQGSERQCKTFLATRNVNIPRRLSVLEKDVKAYSVHIILIYILLVLTFISNILTHL